MKHKPLLSCIAVKGAVTTTELRKAFGLPSGGYLSGAIWEFKSLGYISQSTTDKKYRVTDAGMTLTKFVTSDDRAAYIREMQQSYGRLGAKKAKASKTALSTDIPENTSEVLRYLSHVSKSHQKLEDINKQYMESLAKHFGATIVYSSDPVT